MLVPISQSNLSDTNKVGVSFIRGWDAVDTKNFAYLYRTSGRGKYGLPKYYLLVVINPPETFDLFLEAYTNWDKVFSTIRAWSLNDALEIANKRLPSLLKRAHRPAQSAVEGVM